MTEAFFAPEPGGLAAESTASSGSAGSSAGEYHITPFEYFVSAGFVLAIAYAVLAAVSSARALILMSKFVLSSLSSLLFFPLSQRHTGICFTCE